MMVQIQNLQDTQGLPSNNINDILIDNNGIWICTSNGLANFQNDGFKVITTLDEKSDGLTGLLAPLPYLNLEMAYISLVVMELGFMTQYP